MQRQGALPAHRHHAVQAQAQREHVAGERHLDGFFGARLGAGVQQVFHEHAGAIAAAPRPPLGVAHCPGKELPVVPALGELASFRLRNWPFYWLVNLCVHYFLFSFVRLADRSHLFNG